MILSDALRAERPSLWGSSALLDWEHRGSKEIACRGTRARGCARGYVRACREERHCSLTSALNPVCRCSQTRLCYSEASTGGRRPGKPGDCRMDRGQVCQDLHTQIT